MVAFSQLVRNAGVCPPVVRTRASFVDSNQTDLGSPIRNQNDSQGRITFFSVPEDLYRQCFNPTICTVSRPPPEPLPQGILQSNRPGSCSHVLALPERTL